MADMTEDRRALLVEVTREVRQDQTARFDRVDARLEALERWQRETHEKAEKNEAFWDKVRQMVIGSVVLSMLGTVGAFVGQAVLEALRRN